MPRPPAYISHRLSIRWIPEEASEPTNTIVLTGASTGAFLDVRFIKESKTLDWAFAGYRYTDPDTPNIVKFKHLIDSRTLDEVEDSGTNIDLPDGTTLEVGEMINPRTGKITPYEEIWKDEQAGETDTVLFVRNVEGTTWRARVGKWQLALGRGADGRFWAWRVEEGKQGGWITRDSTESDTRGVKLLPERRDLFGWVEGATVRWNAEEWIVLERDKQVLKKAIGA